VTFKDRPYEWEGKREKAVLRPKAEIALSTSVRGGRGRTKLHQRTDDALYDKRLICEAMPESIKHKSLDDAQGKSNQDPTAIPPAIGALA
jgi:hypothetical protein